MGAGEQGIGGSRLKSWLGVAKANRPTFSLAGSLAWLVHGLRPGCLSLLLLLLLVLFLFLFGQQTRAQGPRKRLRS